MIRSLLISLTLCTSPLLASIEDDLAIQTHSNVEKMVSQDLFSGVVFISKRDEPIYAKAYGSSSKEFNSPNALTTRFDLGEVSSLFTLLAIGKLIDQGKLHLDDTINRYINASYLPKVNLSEIRLIHLLTNTSGLGDMFTTQKEKGLSLWERSSKALYTSLQDYLPLIQTESASFTPGEKCYPSTTAWLLLGLIIEEASQKSFYQFIRDEIIAPLDLHNTGFYNLTYPVNHIATGYEKLDRSWKNNLFERAQRGSSASGAYSSGEDLITLLRALQNLKIVSQSTYDAIFTPYKYLKKPYLPQKGIGLSEPYQGLLFGLTYLDLNPGPQKQPESKLQLSGIKTLPSRYSISTLSTKGKTLCAHIDLFEPSGYISLIISNYGGADLKTNESPSTAIATRIRRLILNKLRAHSHTISKPIHWEGREPYL